MSGIKHLSQLDMRIAPTETNHVVRYGDMVDYVNQRVKSPVRVVLTGNFVGTYAGTPNFTLTATANAALVIDGITLAVNDRILVAGQTDKTQNGIYVATDIGSASTKAVLTRADDFNSSSDIFDGVRVHIGQGTSGADTTWKLISDNPVTLDASNIEFVLDTGASGGVAEKTFTITGDASTTTYAFTHSWNTRNVTHECYNATTFETVGVDFVRSSVNDVQVLLGAPLGAGNNLVLVLRAYV